MTFTRTILAEKPLIIRRGATLSFDFDSIEEAQAAYARLLAELRDLAGKPAERDAA